MKRPSGLSALLHAGRYILLVRSPGGAAGLAVGSSPLGGEGADALAAVASPAATLAGGLAGATTACKGHIGVQGYKGEG